MADGCLVAEGSLIAEGSGRFRRSDRVRASRDYARISKSGRRLAGRSFVMLVADPGPGTRPGSRRIGISASRRVGNAVARNRVKRGIREWFRLNRRQLPKDIDIVVIARQSAATLNVAALAAELDGLSDQLRGVAKPNRTRK